MSKQIHQAASMSKIWLEPKNHEISTEFLKATGNQLLISQILFNRGIKDTLIAQGWLDDQRYEPTSPLELPDLHNAVNYLLDALKNKKRIGIWGDFDVDGQTATTLLFETLRELNASVTYHIPIRNLELRGVNIQHLGYMIDQGIDVLITCDTGISAHAAVDYAHRRGVPVIITDHHEITSELPHAHSIINPKRLPPNHPLCYLPGVGVAYQLMHELCVQMKRSDIIQHDLDLVALGIVADLAELKDDTRWLLKRGINKLRHSPRIGLQMLYEMIELNPENITEEHIAFYIAPRLNSVGRLSDANWMVEFLTTDNPTLARKMAMEIEGLNSQRKLITDQVFQAAQVQLRSNPHLADEGVIVLANPAWPSGVIGIVASRLVDQYHLPVVLFSSPPGQPAHGSARSIEGINITEVISSQAEHLIAFGGHLMAAGLTIEHAKIPAFHRSLVRAIHQIDHKHSNIKYVNIDGYLTLPELTLNLVSCIEQLSPFGPGNPAPILATHGLLLSGYTCVGQNAEHLLLTVEDDSGASQKVIWWQGADMSTPKGKFDLAYTVRSSTYRGQKEVQVEWIDFKPSENEPIILQKHKPAINVIDYRSDDNPHQTLLKLFEHESMQIWGEAIESPLINSLTRNQLITPCDTLTIFTIPPGMQELQEVIGKLSPQNVYLFGVNPGLDSPEIFLKFLTGLIKYASSNNNGFVKLTDLAAASSARISTIQAGLEWLQLHGHIKYTQQNKNDIHIELATNQRIADSRQIAKHLKTLLEETSSFRLYYLRCNKDALINL